MAVEGHAAQAWRTLEIVMRWLGAGRPGADRFGNRLTGIIDAIRRQRPAVIGTGLRNVQFVAAARTVLAGPQRAAVRMQRRTLLIAVAVRPDFRPRIVAPDERIVVGHRAIRVQPHQLALQMIQQLRCRALVVLTQRQEQMTVPVEHDARTEMPAAGQLRRLPENHFPILDLLTDQTSAPERGTGKPVIAGLGIAQIDQRVLRELRRQRHVQQTALPLRMHLRHAGNGRRHRAIGADVAQLPATFGDQHPAIGQKGQRPRHLQPFGHDFDLDLGSLRRCRCAMRGTHAGSR